jgi:hypothetical protein
MGPADDEQGRVAAFEKARRASFSAAAHVIAPVTGLRMLFRSTVPASPVRLDTQRDLSVSRLRVKIDVWFGSFDSPPGTLRTGDVVEPAAVIPSSTASAP